MIKLMTLPFAFLLVPKLLNFVNVENRKFLWVTHRKDTESDIEEDDSHKSYSLDYVDFVMARTKQTKRTPTKKKQGKIAAMRDTVKRLSDEIGNASGSELDREHQANKEEKRKKLGK